MWETLNDAFSNLPEGLVIIDRNGTVVMQNWVFWDVFQWLDIRVKDSKDVTVSLDKLLV